MEAVALEKKKRKVTFAEFREMEIPEGDTHIYELINGQIVKRASPNTPHQRVSHRLNGYFFIYNLEKQVGEFLQAPYDVYLDEHSAGIQPDLLFVAKERNFIIHEGNGVVGAPDLIIEIISKGTGYLDKGSKKDVYERFAVKEYWLIDPRVKSVEIYRMENDKYHLISYAEEEGIVKSSVLPDFELNVKLIF